MKVIDKFAEGNCDPEQYVKRVRDLITDLVCDRAETISLCIDNMDKESFEKLVEEWLLSEYDAQITVEDACAGCQYYENIDGEYDCKYNFNDESVANKMKIRNCAEF